MADPNIKRIIIQNSGHMIEQIKAARVAIEELIQPGDVMGIIINNRAYGVKCNKTSVTVYPSEQSDG